MLFKNIDATVEAAPAPTKFGPNFDHNSAAYSAAEKKGDVYIFTLRDKYGRTMKHEIKEKDMTEDDHQLYRIYSLGSQYPQFGAILDKVSAAMSKVQEEQSKEESEKEKNKVKDPATSEGDGFDLK